MSRFRAAAIVLSLLLSPGLEAQDVYESVHSFSLSRGPHVVGFRMLPIVDSTRFTDVDPTFPAGPRQVNALIWYPAQTGVSDEPVIYGDYVSLEAVKLGYRPINNDWKSVIAGQLLLRYGPYGLTDERLDRELASSTWAFWNAPQAPGPFPVVLYSPGGADPAWDNSVLAEYLASHGYVVAAVPARGWYSARLNYPTGFVGSAAMAADLQRVRHEIRRWPHADENQVAVMGFSRGGITNVLMQMRDPTIQAVVGLEGTVAYRYRRDPTPWSDPETSPGSLESTGFGPPDRLDVPFLWIGSDYPREMREFFGMDPNFLFWDKLRYSQAYRVQIPELQHLDFSSVWIRFGPDAVEFGAIRPPELRNRGYEAVALYVRRFLDAHLKNDSEGLAFLERSPEANGFPPELLSIDRRRPVGPASTMTAFRRLIGDRDFSRADELLADLLAADPNWSLPVPDLVNWGWTLLAGGRCDDAAGVMRLTTLLHPQSLAAWNVLGEVNLALGDPQAAATSYKKAVALDEHNPYALERLAQLKVGATLPRVVQCSEAAGRR